MSIKDILRIINPSYQKLFLEYKVDFIPRYGHGKPPHNLLYNIISRNRENYSALLDRMLSHTETFHSIKDSKEEKDPLKISFNNGYFPALDIFSLYTMLEVYRPERYIEIGSGNSTKVAFKAKSELSLKTEISSIDPMPRASIDQLADKVIRKPFEDIDHSFLNQLKANDILFIDNSHRILPNSDSMVFFMEIFPMLPPGVIVHIHDIYLPYDYPQFMSDRYYSEQYGLAMYLMANPDKYETLLPCFFISEDKQLSTKIDSLFNHPALQTGERHGGSYWLRINS